MVTVLVRIVSHLHCRDTICMTQLMLAAKILCERITGYEEFSLTTKRNSTAGMPHFMASWTLRKKAE